MGPDFWLQLTHWFLYFSWVWKSWNSVDDCWILGIFHTNGSSYFSPRLILQGKDHIIIHMVITLCPLMWHSNLYSPRWASQLYFYVHAGRCFCYSSFGPFILSKFILFSSLLVVVWCSYGLDKFALVCFVFIPNAKYFRKHVRLLVLFCVPAIFLLCSTELYILN